MASPGASEAYAAILASNVSDADKKQLCLYILHHPEAAARFAAMPISIRNEVFHAFAAHTGEWSSPRFPSQSIDTSRTFR